jgi:type IV secretory pathway VirB6-like protein
MKKKEFIKTQILLTSIVSIAIWSLLAWYYFNGGVPSHHILAREDLPEISNWWGAILLPLLTWIVVFRIQKRENLPNEIRPKFLEIPKKVWVGFLGALILGVALSVFFTLGNESMPEYLILSVFFISLFFPVYRAECLLGFVIGMTFTFGAILPTGIGSILAIIGFLIHHLIRPLIIYLFSFINKQ